MVAHAGLIRCVMVTLVGAGLQLIGDASAAPATCATPDQVAAVQAESSVGSIVAGVEEAVANSECPAGPIGPAGENSQAGARDSQLDALCVREALSQAANPFGFCDLAGDPGRPSTLTPGAVARAFRRLPLPGAVLVVQPPGGRTLVNFETNFYTERGGFSRSVRLLGRVVELRIWPASFTWRFGDGAEETSSEPGAAYPDLQITHRYERRGVVAPSVDVTYAAQFRVEGGAWRDVEGMVRIPGTPESLRVVTARPVLVGG